MKCVSLCFDDGLKRSAELAMELLDVPLSFFIVTGWVKEIGLPVKDSYNIGYDHGSLEFWIRVARKHVVGGHGHTHTMLTPDNALDELGMCRQVIKEIAAPPYLVAYPYLKTSPNFYGVFDWQRPFVHMPDLKKYGVEECVAQVVQALGEEDGTLKWLPLGFHGINGEGWQTVSSLDLKEFVNRLVLDEDIGFISTQVIAQKMEEKNDKCIIEFRKEVRVGCKDTAEDDS